MKLTVSTFNFIHTTKIWLKKLSSWILALAIIPTFNNFQIKVRNDMKICFQAIWELNFDLFSPEEGLCYVFSTWKNCCEFLSSDDVNLQGVHRSFYFQFSTLFRMIIFLNVQSMYLQFILQKKKVQHSIRLFEKKKIFFSDNFTWFLNVLVEKFYSFFYFYLFIF